MSSKLPSKRKLKKKAQKGFRGYPIATIAYYGPDNKKATKVAVSIITKEDGEAEFLKRLFSEKIDVRFNELINQQILNVILKHHVLTVVISDGIIGCPHEEGIDYSEGESCPQCPFWVNRDRFTGELIH